jgi:hypothetical protein
VSVREVDTADWRTTIAIIEVSHGRGERLEVLVDNDELVVSVDGKEFQQFPGAEGQRCECVRDPSDCRSALSRVASARNITGQGTVGAIPRTTGLKANSGKVGARVAALTAA